MDILGGIAASVELIEKLVTFVHDARSVVETNNRIITQVDNLIATVRIVNNVLESREKQRGNLPLSDDELKALHQTTNTLEQTNKTINLLREKIEKLGGGRSQAGAWRRGWLQIKTQVQNGSITQIEKQMDRNLNSLQLLILCIQL